MTKILKYVICALSFAFIFASSPSWSQAFDESIQLPCGMEATASGMDVKPYNGEICPQDIAYQSSYLLFSEVLSNPSFRPFVLWFLSEDTLDSDFTLFADETIGVSAGIYFLFSAIALLAWSLFIPVLGIKGFQYYLLVQKSGRWDGTSEDEQSNTDTIKFMAYFLFLIVLMLPAGLTGGKNNDRMPLTVGQVAAIIGVLPANMGGNVLYSTYLHSTNLSSADVTIKEEFLLPSGESIANRLIEGQICQLNTRLALFNLNAKDGSEFFAHGRIFSDRRDNVMERYDSCLAYKGEIDRGIIDDVKSVSVNKSSQYSMCVGNENSRTWADALRGEPIIYKADLFGHNHTCAQVNYDIGLEKFSSLIGQGGVKNLMKGLARNSSAEDFFRDFKVAMEPTIREILDNPDYNSSQRYAALDAAFKNYSDTVLTPMLLQTDFMSEGTNEMKQLKHLVVSGALLGNSVIDRGFWGNAWNSNLSKNSRKYGGLLRSDPEERKMGVDQFFDEARHIALLAQRYHCAVNWADHTAARQFIVSFNQASRAKDVNNLLGSTSAKMQCVEFLPEDQRGDTDFDRYLTYPVDDDWTFDDLEQMDDGTWRVRRDYGDEKAAIQSFMSGQKASEYYEEMQLRRFFLAGYTAVVKKSVADSLRKNLSQREAEERSDEELRGKGWGAMGGALLYLSQSRQSASHAGTAIQDTISVNSGGSDLRYIDRNAFGSDMDENKEMLVRELFEPLDMGTLFLLGEMGAGAYAGPDGIVADDEEAALMQQLFYYLERLFLGPVDHIKSASGMPLDKSLAEGLRGCFDDGGESCLSGGKHPIVAMSHFGHDLMDNMLTMMVASKVVNIIHSMISGDRESEAGDIGGNNARDSEDSSNKKAKRFGKSVLGKLGSLLSVALTVILEILSAILYVAKIVLDALYPLFVILFVGGAIFAYIIPMMAYVYGFMMMMLSIVGVVILGIVIPFYVLSKMWYIDKEYKQGFRRFYEEMVGPYLTPLFFVVSAIVSWTVIVVIMYGINTTFALLYQGLSSAGSSGWGISSFVLYIMMYVIYFVAIFVLFRFGLGIMKSMPDLLKEKVGLKKSNDEAYVESLGFEQYVNAQVMKTIGEMPAKAAGRLAQKMGQKMSNKELEAAVKLAEEQAEVIRRHGGPEQFAAKMAAVEDGLDSSLAKTGPQATDESPAMTPDRSSTKGDESSQTQEGEEGPMGPEPPIGEPQGPESDPGYESENDPDYVQDKDDLRTKSREDRAATSFERDPDMDGPSSDDDSAGSQSAGTDLESGPTGNTQKSNDSSPSSSDDLSDSNDSGSSSSSSSKSSSGDDVSNDSGNGVGSGSSGDSDGEDGDKDDKRET